MLYTVAFDILPSLLGKGDPVLAAALALAKDTGNPLLKPTVEWIGPDFNNTPTGRKSEIPSAGMYANARSIAKCNACIANGGQLGSVRLMSEEATADMGAGMVNKEDEAMKWHFPFSQGGIADFGSAKGASVDPNMPLLAGFLGWGGWGGSISMWNPSKQVSVCYAMNGMSLYVLGGPRSKSIFEPLSKIVANL